MVGPLFEKVCMNRDLRDRWQEIWFDPFVETAVHEMMCSRNSSCGLNCAQLPAASLTASIAQIVFDLLVVTVGKRTVG